MALAWLGVFRLAEGQSIFFFLFIFILFILFILFLGGGGVTTLTRGLLSLDAFFFLVVVQQNDDFWKYIE